MVPPTGPAIAAFKASTDLNMPMPSPKVSAMLPPLANSRSVTALGQDTGGLMSRKQS